VVKVLLTGACGFIGSHIAGEIVNATDWDVVALDRLTYAGQLGWLSHLPASRVRFIYYDLRRPFVMPDGVSCVIANAAESHVARSLKDPEIFVESNIEGALNVLEAARQAGVEKFLYTSTDEVYGESTNRPFLEGDPLRPSNPYAATKAAAELLVRAYGRSYGLPVVVTRTSNLYGERQHPEKFVPRVVRQLLRDELVTLHTDADGRFCQRSWLYVRNQASAIIHLLNNFTPGEVYNVAGKEASVLDIARFLADILGQPMVADPQNVVAVNPGHDQRYRTDDSKLRATGWLPPEVDLYGTLRRTARWYRDNLTWLEAA